MSTTAKEIQKAKEKKISQSRILSSEERRTQMFSVLISCYFCHSKMYAHISFVARTQSWPVYRANTSVCGCIFGPSTATTLHLSALT